MAKKRLCKSRQNRVIAGVCGGLADYFNVDPTIVRICVVIFACIKGVGLLAYIIAALVMPINQDEDFDADDDVENLKSANMDSSSEKKSAKSEKTGTKSKSIHSDEEFNKFFK